MNESAIWILEYVSRMRLAKLGFTQSLESLDADHAEALLIIDKEIMSLNDPEFTKLLPKA